MHNLPGGVCTAWKRGGYTFDGCIHWLMGSGPCLEHAPDVAGAARRAGPALRGVGRVHARAHLKRRDLHVYTDPRPAARRDAAPRPARTESSSGSSAARSAGSPRSTCRSPPRRWACSSSLGYILPWLAAGAGHENLGDHERADLLLPAEEPRPGGGPGYAVRRRGQHARFPGGGLDHDAGLHAQEVQRLPHRRLAGVRPGHRAALPGAGRAHPLQRARGEDPGGGGPGRGRPLRRGRSTGPRRSSPAPTGTPPCTTCSKAAT